MKEHAPWVAAAVVASAAAAFLASRLGFVSTPYLGVSAAHVSLAAAAVAVVAVTLKLGFDARPNASPVRSASTEPASESAGAAALPDELADGSGAVNVPDSVVDRDSGSGTARRRGSTSDDGFSTVGADFDGLLTASVNYDVDADIRGRARTRVVETLRETAALAWAQSHAVSTAEAEDTVLSGEWTDDPRARALLAEDDEVTVPLKHRVFDLLAGRDPFLAGVDHAVDEITGMGAAR